MASRTAKSLVGIRCFLRPHEWFPLGIEPSTCCCSSVFRPNGHGKLLIPLGVRQLWLYLQPDNIFYQHIYGCFCWLSLIFPRKNRMTKPTQQGELHKRKLLLSSANAPENSLIFRCRCKHQTPWCKRLKLN